MNRVLAVFFVLALSFAALAHEPAELTTIILVRHAEKVADPSSKDPALTGEGEQRAQTLARMLEAAGVDAIYTTPYTRTRDTAAPLATAMKLTPVEIAPAPTFARDMAARLREHRGQTVLVVGHSNSTQDVIRALGIADAPKIDDHTYDDFFIVTIGEGAETRMLRLKY